MFETGRLDWKAEIFRQDHEETSPLPHAICSILAEVDGTLADQDLTIHEMRAIMRMIMRRTRGSRRKWPVYPVSA